ncbi:MAG: hypothetical protein JW881_07755 [Spirochaetales bacterium]|nr:hypothetical protein [Spirochaetales bacterium]
MKKMIFMFISLSIISCLSMPEDSEYLDSIFYIHNACSTEIIINSSVMKPSSIHGWQEVRRTDTILPQTVEMMRNIKAVENVKISSIFKTLEIYKSNKLIEIDVFDNNYWKVEKADYIKYTLKITEDMF